MEKHHYEAEIHQKHTRLIVSILSEQCQTNIKTSSKVNTLMILYHSKFGLAQHYYGVMEHLTNLSLLEIENKLYAPEYEEQKKLHRC